MDKVTEGSVSRIDPDDCVVLFADLQEGIVERAHTIPQGQLRKAVLAVGKLAKLFGMPVVVSGIQGQDGVSVMTLAGEIAGDFREARAQAAVGILYEMAGG
jgi:hypothetical protein